MLFRFFLASVQIERIKEALWFLKAWPVGEGYQDSAPSGTDVRQIKARQAITKLTITSTPETTIPGKLI